VAGRNQNGRNKNMMARAAEYSSLALMLPASTFVGYIIGYYLDKAFGTTWLRIVFLILGSIGGFIELIRQIMRDSSNDRST
jgi:F0F1-type ATP synthase assembly protein I